MSQSLAACGTDLTKTGGAHWQIRFQLEIIFYAGKQTNMSLFNYFKTMSIKSVTWTTSLKTTALSISVTQELGKFVRAGFPSGVQVWRLCSLTKVRDTQRQTSDITLNVDNSGDVCTTGNVCE